MSSDTRGRNPRRFRGPVGALLLANLVLAALKLWLGYQGDSLALRSDGWNNAADFFYSALVGVGLWISVQPPDRTHPEGHRRFESLTSLGVAGLILLTGGVVLWDVIGRLSAPRPLEVGRAGILLLGVSMVLKILLSLYCRRVGKTGKHHSLTAIARDQMSDVLVDFSVLVAVFSSTYGMLWVDPTVAGLVGLVILAIGGRTFRESIHYLTGRSPSRDLLERVRESGREIEVFSRPFAVRAHYVGPTIHLSLNVKANRDCSLERIHEGEENLRDRLLQLPDVSRVFIHVEPYEADSPN